MAGMDWWRSWHGAPTDNKWLLIGRKAGVAPGIVSAVAWALLDYASQQQDRGSVEGFDVEVYSVFSGFSETDIQAVIDAMTDKGILLNGRLASWDKRQPKREDSSTERVRKHREEQRNAAKRNVTQCNAAKQDVTLEEIREDQIREEERDEGMSYTDDDELSLPESDPEWAVVVSKLKEARIGKVSDTALLELSALWPNITNGRRAWLDDAIAVAQANGAKSPSYAIRVLSNAIQDNKRPRQESQRKTARGKKREDVPNDYASLKARYVPDEYADIIEH